MGGNKGKMLPARLTAPPGAIRRARPSERPALAAEAPPPLEAVPRQQLGAAGVSRHSWTAEERRRLSEPFPPESYRIRPEGFVYLPHAVYRRRLDDIFGPGRWGITRTSTPQFDDAKSTASDFWALLVDGLVVADAAGEAEWVKTNPLSSRITAIEGAESKALSRICSKRGVMGKAARVDEDTFQYEFRLAHGILYKTFDGGAEWRSIHEPPRLNEVGVDDRSPNRERYRAPTAAERIAANPKRQRGDRQQRRRGPGGPPPSQEPPRRQLPAPSGTETITGPAIGQLERACEQHQITVDALKSFLSKRFGYKSRTQIKKSEYNEVLDWIRAPYDLDPDEVVQPPVVEGTLVERDPGEEG